MDYNSKISSLFEKIAENLKSGNSNVDAETFDIITDCINKSTIIPDFMDRENVIRYMDISDAEFSRLTYKGTKFHPVTPLLSTHRVQGLVKPVYLRSDIDELLKSGNVRHKKARGKYKTRNIVDD